MQILQRGIYADNDFPEIPDRYFGFDRQNLISASTSHAAYGAVW